MNVNKCVRRPFVFILMIMLLLMSLSACGGNGEEPGADSEAAWRENAQIKVFGVDLTQEAAVQQPAQVICGDRNAWVITTMHNDFIYQFDYNTDMSAGQATAQIEWQQADTEYLVNIAERNGTLYAEVRDIEKNTNEIRKRTGTSWSTIMTLEAEGDAWVYGSGLFVDSNENVYLAGEDIVTRYDTEGERARQYELEGSAWLFQENGNGYVDCVVTDSNGITLYELKENAAEAKWTLTSSASQVYNIQSSQEGRLCLAAGSEILFLDRDTGEVLERADLAAIGISSFYAGHYNAGKDTLWLYGNSGVDSSYLFCSLLSGRDDAAAAQRTELVYAVINNSDSIPNFMSSRLDTAIMTFNQSNENYYITMKHYDLGDDAAIQRLNMELAGGIAPDIIQMCNSTAALYDAYVENGYLVDLHPYLEQSEYADDLLWNVLDTYDRNGGLYQLVPHFLLSGVTVHPEYIDSVEEWNMAAFLELIEQDQWEKDILRNSGHAEYLLQNMLLGVQGDYADWEQKRASFDSEGFIQILTLCKEYGEQNWSDIDYDNPNFLVNSVRLYSGYSTIAGEMTAHYGNEYPIFGYPTSSGQIYQIETTLDACAINANSDNIEGAWEFVESLLVDSYQDMDYGGNVGFPIRDSALQRSAEKVMEKTYIVNNTQCKITEGDIKIVDDIIHNEVLFSYEERDRRIWNIIYEETGAYFAGDKSAEDVARIIQNRVQLMLDEY